MAMSIYGLCYAGIFMGTLLLSGCKNQYIIFQEPYLFGPIVPQDQSGFHLFHASINSGPSEDHH